MGSERPPDKMCLKEGQDIKHYVAQTASQNPINTISIQLNKNIMQNPYQNPTTNNHDSSAIFKAQWSDHQQHNHYSINNHNTNLYMAPLCTIRSSLPQEQAIFDLTPVPPQEHCLWLAAMITVATPGLSVTFNGSNPSK